MPTDRLRPTLGADKAHDAEDFVNELHASVPVFFNSLLDKRPVHLNTGCRFDGNTARNRMKVVPYKEWISDRPSGLKLALMAVPAVVALVVVLWLFTDRVTGEQIREPLTWDEILNVENYSWATFRSNGLPTHAHRVQDLLNVQRPNVLQLVAGLYRAIAVWREPNDHVVHSVLLNLSTALAPGTETAVRLPAWAGALVFTVALAWLAWRSGFRLAWPLVLLVAASWPYVHYYSLQARGYSWMLALQALLLLLLADILPTRSRSIALGALCGFVAILSFWNIISLIADWLAPLYLGLWLFPPGRHEVAGSAWSELSPEDRRAYRQNLLAQGIVLGFFVLLFFVQFLPYVLVAIQEYGMPAHGLDFFRGLASVLTYLFPNAAWALVGIAGVIGWCFLCLNARTRHLGVVCVLSASISLAHFGVAQKLPYARTCGYFLPLVTLGAGYLAELVLRRVADHLKPIVTGAAVIGVSLLVLLQHATLRSSVSELVGYKQRLQHEFVNDRPYVTTLDPDDGWTRIGHVPSRYLTVFDRLDQIVNATHLAFLVNQKDSRSRSWAGEASWPKLDLPDRVLQFSPATVRLVQDGPAPTRFPALIVWVLAPDREEIRNELLRAAFDGLNVKRVISRRILLTKWEFVNQVYALEILIKNPEDYQEALEALRRGRNTLRGHALLIEPTGG